MSPDYIKMTVDALSELSSEKQLEVYDFAMFLKASNGKTTEKNKKESILNIIGLGDSKIGDLSVNHDKYLYDEK